MRNSINKSVLNATKWSSITEICARLVVPITNMILARILTPEAFGVIATITMIISFSDMFTDVGFQKYLIQHDFIDDKDKFDNTAVAFWTNLSISVLLWSIIAVFSENIATIVGNPGLGKVFIVAGISLPLTTFSSIQMALYKRDFDYKTLFFVRIISIFIPFIVTIPLALMGFSFWALLIGTIFANFVNASILTIKSPWKPYFFYDLNILKNMFSFSLWSLAEGLSIWLTQWSGVFVVGSILSTHHMGIYRISISTVNGIMGLITSATTSILFSSLSRLKNNQKEYDKMFYKFQKNVSMLVLPVGIGIFVYRDFITLLFLGEQWQEASLFIGMWGLTSSLAIIFAHYSSEIYRSKGKPNLSFLAQVFHLIVLIPVLIISANQSFTTFIFARTLVRLQFILVHFIIMHYVIKLSPWKMLINVFPFIVGSVIMGICGYYFVHLSNNSYWLLFSIFVSSIIYFTCIAIFPSIRNDLLKIVAYIYRSIKVKKWYTTSKQTR